MRLVEINGGCCKQDRMIVDSIRKNVKSLLVNLMLLMLVASFGLWGIGDIFRGGFGANYVAKVGEITISPDEFQNELRFRLSNLRRILGDNYSAELVQQLGLPQQVLQSMVKTALIQQETQRLNIQLSSDELMKQIRENENFRSGAQFDKDTFVNALRQAGLNEKRYLETLAKENAETLLLGTFKADGLVHETLVELLYNQRHETRDVTLYTIPSIRPSTIAKPNDAALKSFYESHKTQFKTPEYRSLAFITFTSTTIFGDLEPDESRLRALYEERKSSYMTAEKRTVSQLLYESREQAMQAHSLLKQGDSMAKVSQAAPPTNKELSLGTITRNTLPSSAQSLVFSIQKGNYTNPIETSFGWHIFRVDAVIESLTPAFSTLKKRLQEELLAAEKEEKLYDFSIELEDQTATGVTLQEIAKERGLSVTQTHFFSKNGLPRTAKATNNLPAIDNIIDKAFSASLREMPELLSSDDGSYYLVTVADVVESSIPELNTIQADVIKAYAENEALKATRIKADKAALSLKDGKTPPHIRISKKTKLTHPALDSASENAHDSTFPTALRETSFTLELNKPSNAYRLANGEYAILKLTKRHSALGKSDPKYQRALATIRTELIEEYNEELLNAYLTHLEKSSPVSVNQALLKSLL